jgi:hypothetical protein
MGIKMATQANTPNKKPRNIFSLLSGSEKTRLHALLAFANSAYDQYLEKLEEVMGYLEELEAKYSKQENERAKETSNKIKEIKEKFRDLMYNIPSPYNLLKEAQKEN